VAILLCSVSGATISLASTPNLDISKETSIIPYPGSRYPDIKVAKGVAVNKNTLEAEPVIFLIMNYNGKTSSYLFIDGHFYTMEEVERSDGWQTGTKVFKYKANDGSIMTAVVQHFDSYNVVSIVADFKNYLINFEPINSYVTKPIPVAETISTTERPVYEEVVKKLKQTSGINIQDILNNPVGQITEWIQ
jgi:hypothetical protein